MKISQFKNRVIIKNVIIFILCVSVGWWLKSRLTPQMPSMMAGSGETYVLTAKAKSQNTTPLTSYIGTVEAINSVNIRAQITGYVEKVLFKEGTMVNKGDILFVIEQERYIATVDLRQAELEKAKAYLYQVERNHKRQSSLSKQKFASEAQLDTAYSDFLQAKASVKQAQANLDLAKINLEYTEVKAPISGYIGKALVTEGNYVDATNQTLARIVQNNPVRVDFSMSDKEFINTREKLRHDGKQSIKVNLTLPNGKIAPNKFTSVFTDNEFNSSTATIPVYVEFNNDNNLLVPGNYVKVLISEQDPNNSVIIPQAAISQDENGSYVTTVNQDNIAEQKRIVLGESFDGKQVVKEGLKDGDIIIVQGHQKVKNGQKVKAEEIKEE